MDAIGLSVLSGAHKYLFGRVLELFREKGVEDVSSSGEASSRPRTSRG